MNPFDPVPMRLLFTMLLLLATAAVARAQLGTDTTRAIVGQEARVAMRYDGSVAALPGEVTVSGWLLLGNPTVFLPQRLLASGGDTLVKTKLTRKTDSIYTFEITLRLAPGRRAGDTLFELAGEALAGSDSLCALRFWSVTIGDHLADNVTGLIISSSVGTPFPYVRFATLEQNYPNPVPAGSGTTWAYRIDKPSRVIFRIYDMSLREMIYADLGDQPLGIHTFTLADLSPLANGAYVVRMTTSSGEAHRFMHVLR